MTEALENLAQVATDQLFAFDTTNFLTPQLARQVPFQGSEDFVTGIDEPTNIFGEPIDFHDTTVTGTNSDHIKHVVYFGSSNISSRVDRVGRLRFRNHVEHYICYHYD